MSERSPMIVRDAAIDDTWKANPTVRYSDWSIGRDGEVGPVGGAGEVGGVAGASRDDGRGAGDRPGGQVVEVLEEDVGAAGGGIDVGRGDDTDTAAHQAARSPTASQVSVASLMRVAAA